MKIKKALANINRIYYPAKSPEAVRTSVSWLIRQLGTSGIRSGHVKVTWPDDEAFRVAVASYDRLKSLGIKKPLKPKERYIYFLLRKKGSGYLVSSHTCYLYSFIHHLFNNLAEQNVEMVHCGRWFVPAFKWQRITYDYFLTQQGRIQEGFNRESYISELARLGYTHIEINGLAFPKALETGPEGETYPMFYTYCPALDQFVYSRLNKRLYPGHYLDANLAYLKENAEIAIRFGLTPGLLCFEPRSVPERFFRKYPMLRGARVDHPFRSFKPRYNMTITHPLVRDHYAEMIRKLIKEVPELGYISIWTNDSGAGFEHTKSLYVGRNGGAYLIREWKDDEEIARLAGENALRFFRLIRDEARKINPEFRVITRMESFYGEYDTVWEGLTEGVDIETSSLMARGWEMPYTHPRYEESHDVNAGTVYQMDFDDRERTLTEDLSSRNSDPHFYFSAGPHSMFDPLLGIPYPVLTYRRLKILYENGVGFLACTGGISPPEMAPFDINQEIIRSFQYNPDMNIDAFLEKITKRWAGDEYDKVLLKAWKLAEEAILAFPNITPLYSTFGFTWYRLWARPLVPDIEKIPPGQRKYYEDFMCTTPHNPNNVDLSRDVLFRLTSPDKCTLNVKRIDSNVWKPLDSAIEELNRGLDDHAKTPGKYKVLTDQFIRLRALRCWIMTQRNVAAWISGVYGYMTSENEKEKSNHRENVSELIRKEIENTKVLSELLDSGVEFMAMTGQEETQLMYGRNLKRLLEKRINLMEQHMDDEPFIDHGYMERKAGEILSK
ncbi:MAG: hypothetical protein JSV24_12230 [Bacteroidales bacterium]|nr:MAG: hypothetical protein JSV24_12230 [Bacteroidales bacterium]